MTRARHSGLGSVAAAIAAAVALGVVACSGSSGSTMASGSGGGDDGTRPLVDGRAFAFVTGHLDTTVSTNVHVFVNGSERQLVVEPDRTFVLRDLPSGDVTISAVLDAASGETTLHNVQPGESIQVAIAFAADAQLAVTLLTDTPPSAPPQQVTNSTTDVVVVSANGACVALPEGTCGRDVVVTGNDVIIAGATSSCDAGRHSVLSGTLTIRGDGCSVVDVDLEGAVDVSGANARFEDDCSKCWDDACIHAHGGGGGDDQGDDDDDGHGDHGHGHGHGDHGKKAKDPKHGHK